MAVLDAIRERCGTDLIIEFRISLDENHPEGMKPDDTIEVLKMIEDKIDIVHVSAGLLTIPHFIAKIIQPYNAHTCSMSTMPRSLKKILVCPLRR